MILVNPRELYLFLKSNNINYLYHANTVATSCTFINKGGLLSRGVVEKLGLFQTPQDSDEKDKEVMVWNDIFLDAFDLHIKYKKPNKYGPVCFVLKIELLLDENLPNVCITKSNPWYWESTSRDNTNYFSSVKEYQDIFDESYSNNTIQQKMITICDTSYVLSFNNYLVQIILDNPNLIVNNVNLYNNAFKIIQQTLLNNAYDKNILSQRECPYPGCYCLYNYSHWYHEPKLSNFFLQN